MRPEGVVLPAPVLIAGTGQAGRATPPESGRVPAWLLQLRQLLRSQPKRQHPRCRREDGQQQLPTGLIYLGQLLPEQPKQNPRDNSEDRELLPIGLVRLG